MGGTFRPDRPAPKVALSPSDAAVPAKSDWTESLALMDAKVPQLVKVER